MRLYNRAKHIVERFVVRGATYQLLFVAALIGLISLLAGALVRFGGDGSTSWADAIWWAFLRLTDPGYLGDDTGVLRRSVSTVLTVLGYVLFMGSLVAILTQWLNTTLHNLESGLTPVARNDHVLILGWTDRVAIVVRDLFASEERVQRFLARRGARKLHMVVLADKAGAAMRSELKTRVGRRWQSSQVTLRSGSVLRSDHLRRVDFAHASAIILPSGDFLCAGHEAVDTATIKALLSLSSHPDVDDSDHLPLAVAELLDVRKAEIAETAYAGPVEVIAADAVISRLLAQTIRQPGLSRVYTELVSHGAGNELYIRDFPELHGRPIVALAPFFDTSIPVGCVRQDSDGLHAVLNADADELYRPGDRLVVMAPNHDLAVPMRGAGSAHLGDFESRVHAERQTVRRARRLLCLGWSHKVPSLLTQLSRIADRFYEVHIASAVPVDERKVALARMAPELGDLQIKHFELDYTVVSDVARLELSTFEHIVIVGSDWLPTGEQADARTLVGCLTLQKVLKASPKQPHIVVELLDASNAELLGKLPGEILVSPVVLSRMLTQVALRRELNAVFENLFTLGGTEISFRNPEDYGYDHGPLTFAAFQRDAMKRGEIALGFLLQAQSGRLLPRLNPSRSAETRFHRGEKLIVLTDSACFDGPDGGEQPPVDVR